MKKLYLFLFFIGATLLFFCNANAEDITITTYYPAPYGVYKTLRLYPHDDFVSGGACANQGEMYFDQSDSIMYVCSGGTWQSMGGGYWSLDVPQNLLSPTNANRVKVNQDFIVGGSLTDGSDGAKTEICFNDECISSWLDRTAIETGPPGMGSSCNALCASIFGSTGCIGAKTQQCVGCTPGVFVPECCPTVDDRPFGLCFVMNCKCIF